MIYINCLAPDTLKTQSLFGYTSVIKRMDFSERLNTSNIEQANIANLESCKLIREIDFKHKKDIGFIQIKGIDEFYTIEVYKISKKELPLKHLSKEFDLIPTIDKNNHNWLENTDYRIPHLEHSIQRKLDSELELF